MQSPTVPVSPTKARGISRLKDDSLSDLDNLPEPDEVAAEIVVSLEAALNGFRRVIGQLAT